MADWYGLASVDVVKLFRSNSIRGLNNDEVFENRKNYGENKITSENKKRFVYETAKKIFEPWFILLILCSLIFIYLNEIGIFVIIFAFVVLNFCSNILFSYKKYKEIKNVEKFNYNLSSVLRGGRLVKLKAEEIVVGDIITFSKGDIVPCEIRIIECDNLKVNEVNVTGDESIVEKFSAKIGGDGLPISEMRNMLFKSSLICEGEGEGIVVAVGENTEFGKIMSSFFEDETIDNFFIKKIERFMNVFSFIPVIISAIVLAYKNGSNYSIYEAALICISGIPMEVSFILFEVFVFIKKYLKGEKIILKDLDIIERLSKVNVVSIEKEDALTKNEMYIKKIYDNTSLSTAEMSLEWNINIERIMNIGILCNDYNPTKDGNINLNIIEGAILDYVERKGIDIFEVKGIRRIFEIPYDGDKRIKTTVNKIDRKYRANVKGAVDVLLEKCTQVMIDGVEKELTTEIVNRIKLADIEMSSEGLYVMGFAYRNFNYKPTSNENIESNLVFAGLVGFDNPIKENFKMVLERCRNNNIKPIIFTEDSKLTAISVGKKTGLVGMNSIVMSGIEMDNMPAEEFERNIEKVSIYSRVSNANKVNMVKVLKNVGHNIIMCGSKLTELPVLNEANLSIASGERCNRIIKKLSDMYLIENDFGKIIRLIINSKKLIVNLRDIVKNLVIGNISLVILLSIFVFSGYKVPLNASEILWIIFVCFNMNSIAIFSNCKKVSAQYDYEIEKEELWNINIISIVVSGFFISLLSLAGYYFLQQYKGYDNSFNMVFCTFLYAVIIYTFINRFEKNMYFYIVLILNLIIQSTIAFTKLGSELFGVGALSLYQVEIMGVTLAIEIILLSIKKLFV